MPLSSKITHSPFVVMEKMPEFEPVEILDLDCPHCRRMIRVPIPPNYTDWRMVSEQYREMYEAMVREFERLIAEASTVFDVPLTEFFENERRLMIAQMNELLKRFAPETHAEEGDETS